MSKRKAKKYNKSKSNDNAIINNIDKLEVKAEIDYDKLAEAIVKAQEKAKDNEDKKIKNLFSLHKNTTAILYKALGIMGYIISILFVMAMMIVPVMLKWTSFTQIVANIIAYLVLIVTIIFILVFSIMLHRSSDEIETLKDKQLLISLSTSLTGFIALVVAIITIFVK